MRLSAIGDIIHGLPVAAHLKKAIPDAEITWLTERAGLELLENNAAVDRTILFPKKQWLSQVKSGSLWKPSVEAWAFLARLKALKFDAAIDLQGLFKSALLAFASAAPLRFGFNGTREGAARFLTHACDVGDYFGNARHVVDLNLDVARLAVRTLHSATRSDNFAGGGSGFDQYIYDGPAEFPLPAPGGDVVARIGSLIKAGSSSGDKVITLIPGTTWSTKIWPEAKWCRVAQELAKDSQRRLVLVGGPPESALNKAIESTVTARGTTNVTNLTGQTSLLDLIALFRLSDLVVGADTGPLHLAAATGSCPVLGIYGSTPDLRNGPYGDQCEKVFLDLSCRPCFQKKCRLGTIECLAALEPEVVLDRIYRIL